MQTTVTKTDLETRRHHSPSGFLAYVGALLLTIYAFAINSITFATNDYTSIVVQAVACAAVAIVLVVVAWRRIPPAGRAIATLLVLANLWTLVDAGGRRLPSLLGW